MLFKSLEQFNRFQKVSIAIFILTILWLLFFSRLLIPQENQLIIREGDFTAIYYGLSWYPAERLMQGEIPFWNPYNNVATPSFADPQQATWYPPRLLAILVAKLTLNRWSFPFYQLEVALHYWLLSLLSYYFFHTLVKKSFPALIGAILFAYGGYAMSFPMEQVAILESSVWLPLALLGIHLAISTQWKTPSAILAGIGLSLSFLGGHPQTFLYVVYLTGAYWLFLSWHQRIGWKNALQIGVIMGLALVGLTAIQWLPTLEFIPLSFRNHQLSYAEKSVGYALQEYLITIYPRFRVWSSPYIGTFGFLLAVRALFHRSRIHLFWGVIALLSLLVSLGGNAFIYDLFYRFAPAFSFFRQQERAVFLFSFALTILAVYQLADFQFQKKSIVLRFIIISLGLHIIILILHQVNPITNLDTNRILYVLLFTGLFVGWFYLSRLNRMNLLLLQIALFLIITADIFVIGWQSGNWVADTPENRVQPHPYASILQTDDNLQWRVAGSHGLVTYGPYHSIPDTYPTGPLYLASIPNIQQNVTTNILWEIFSPRYLTIGGDLPPAYARYLGDGTNFLDVDYSVYELNEPRPMAHLIYDYRQATNHDEVYTLMNDNNQNLREIAVGMVDLPFELSGSRPLSSQVNSFIMYQPEYMEINVSTPENALLSIAMPGYPGWSATVNGNSVEVIELYGGLLGIPIEAGNNQTIIVRFVSQSFIIGAVITLTTIISLFLYFFILFKKRSRYD